MLKEIAFKFDTHTAIVNSPDTEMKEIFLEGLHILQTHPDILQSIQADIDTRAIEKKRLRRADKAYVDAMTGSVFGDQTDAPSEQAIILKDGRPRLLDAEAVFFMKLLRGHLSSVTSIVAVDRLVDSQLVHAYFQSKGQGVPAATTLHDALSALSVQTEESIFNAVLKTALADKLDDMATIGIDSFSLSADTSWPTDSRILMGLLNRAFRIGCSLKKIGLPGFSDGWIPAWLKAMKQLDFEIGCFAGKPNSKKQIKQRYRRLLRCANKILDRLVRQCIECMPLWDRLQLMPSQAARIEKRIQWIHESIHMALRVYAYAEDRVFRGVHLPAPQKVLSLSDPCAAFILKGGREPVIGYKPQVCRTGNGLISVIDIQSGNPADSSRLEPVVDAHMAQTGRIPRVLTTDDGYSCRASRQRLLAKEIEVVSFNGSKGKAIIPDTDWDSPEYQAARNHRSAVESLISILRSKFHLARLSRRGLERVRSELTEKAIAYNLWRMAGLRRQKTNQAAA